MPSFLHDLRRLSKSSFRTDRSAHSNRSSDSSTAEPSNKSSSTLETAPGSATPPSTLPSEKSSSNLHAAAMNGNPPLQRPSAHSSNSSRYSIVGGSSLTLATSSSSPTQSRSQQPTSPYAPRVDSVSDGSWVNQKVFLIHGQIADPAQQSVDGQLWIVHEKDSFPATSWPVCDSHFKALVHLQPGPNRLRLDFVAPRIPTPNGSPAHTSWININYLPLLSAPPLELVILLARDSPETFDATPDKIKTQGNGLDAAIRKFRMAAYLWQAFTGEQMYRNGFGRRCFRFEESWQPGTLSFRDAETGQMRNEAKIHIVRTDKSVQELRDLELAQQNPNASKAGDLYSIAMDAVKKYFHPSPGQTRYVSVLLLDTHWDSKAKMIRGHAALGGGDGSIQLAVFGSHALHTYPSCIEEVVTAFTDCTRTDTAYVANDCNESGSHWEAANIGIGAHMHETGHLFGCPHQESGVMLRDYVRLHRTFICREPYSTRTKSPGQRLCLQQDECAWHRLDCLRFRFHPSFRHPADAVINSDTSIQVWAVDNNNILVTAQTGVAWIELYTEGDELCRVHLECFDRDSPNPVPPRQVVLTEAELRSRLPADKMKKKLKLEIFSAGQGKQVVEDIGQLAAKSSRIKMPQGQFAFRGAKLGFSQLEGSRPEEMLLWYATDQRKLLTSVRVFHGYAVDGMEFVYEDATTQLFGKRGGSPGGSEFALDVRRGEMILGFYLRAGLWIDGIQILTSLGRRSEIFGNPNGGSGHTVIPPRGYTIAGISGSCGGWMDGFQLLITR